MKNLFKNALITVLLSYTVFTLMLGNHGAIFIPMLIFVMGTLFTYGAYEAEREAEEEA